MSANKFLNGTLQNILDQRSLKWIFVGGKGGVGKTTTSCALALLLSQCRESVLLISTDPAHNLSDAFGTKFGKDPTIVPGTTNVYAMEIDPTASLSELVNNNDGDDDNGASGHEKSRNSSSSPLSSLMSELSGALPGIDEAMGFAQVMKLIQNMQYDVIVFDTAPTGHTLRFLSFPSLLEKALSKIGDIGGGLFAQVGAVMGMPMQQADQMMNKVKDLTTVVQKVNLQFQDDSLTTFICVAIAEFLSLYETERLIQELLSFNIDTHNIVVNQLLFSTKSNTTTNPIVKGCEYCQARWQIQCKYLEQMDDLYGEDFHLIKVPMLAKEVRGLQALQEFSQNLLIERHQ